ncbi:MAG: hypothetical protein PVI81_01765 [Anaerolineales bacterium]|jgi:hypothetical protein
MKTNDVVPVLISILVIILVAIVEKQSKLLAAVTATMPLTAPLALWIVYSSVGGDQAQMELFSRSLVLGILPTFAFLITVWLTSRAGMPFLATVAIGYGVWGFGFLLLLALKNVLNLQ